jgi:hypothetical protein
VVGKCAKMIGEGVLVRLFHVGRIITPKFALR